MAAKSGNSPFMVGIILGGLVGGAWAVFNAPRPGVETRARLLETAARELDRGVVGLVEAGESLRNVGRPATTLTPELVTSPRVDGVILAKEPTSA